MHEKELSLLARVLPHMAARWRLHRDLETLAALPDGRIRTAPGDFAGSQDEEHVWHAREAD